MTSATWLFSITALLFGLNIGSFLNVVIWRIPRNESLLDPQYSYCPHCKRRLTGIDLVPLFSYLLLSRKCRTCKQPISPRYFTVELLTGLLFFGLAIRFQQNIADAVALMLFTALLIPMTFIDLEFFAIPEQLNLLAFAVAIGRDVWGIARHEPDHAPLLGWLPRSIVGALVGIAIFGGVRLIGWLWKRREAMGLGDVLLARAIGAMLVQLVPASMSMFGLFPAWVLFSCLSGMIVGIPMLFLRPPGEEEPDAKIAEGNNTGKRGKTAAKVELGEPDADSDEPPETLKSQLLDIGYVLSVYDLVEYVKFKMSGGRTANGDAVPSIADDDFDPDPHAIPFGPFLALGFLATVFAGAALTGWYIAIAFPKH